MVISLHISIKICQGIDCPEQRKKFMNSPFNNITVFILFAALKRYNFHLFSAESCYVWFYLAFFFIFRATEEVRSWATIVKKLRWKNIIKNLE